jgi:hypothetical protein
LISCSTDGNINFYDINQNKKVNSLSFPSSPFISLSFCSDGNSIGVGDVYGNLFLYDLRNPRKPKITLPNTHVFILFCFVYNYFIVYLFLFTKGLNQPVRFIQFTHDSISIPSSTSSSLSTPAIPSINAGVSNIVSSSPSSFVSSSLPSPSFVPTTTTQQMQIPMQQPVIKPPPLTSSTSTISNNLNVNISSSTFLSPMSSLQQQLNKEKINVGLIFIDLV